VKVVMTEGYCQQEKNALNTDHHQKLIIFQKKTAIFKLLSWIKIPTLQDIQKLI
jgi:hypothetical protein